MNIPDFFAEHYLPLDRGYSVEELDYDDQIILIEQRGDEDYRRPCRFDVEGRSHE